MVNQYSPGVYIEKGAQVADDVLIGANAVILSAQSDSNQNTIIESKVEIGANATVFPGVTIGVCAKIMPGSVVTRSVPPLAIVQGNPALIIGYVQTQESLLNTRQNSKPSETSNRQVAKVQGVNLHTLRLVPDLRGSLSVAEFEREIPFKPSRYFIVYDVPTAETRGEHAHLNCHQFLIAVKGSVNVIADDGSAREEFILDKPNYGLHLPPMIWGIQYRYSRDAVLLVFASHYYDANDYIRNYSEFLKKIKHA